MSSDGGQFTESVLAACVDDSRRKAVSAVFPFAQFRDARSVRSKMARGDMAEQGVIGARRDHVTSVRRPDLRGFGTNRSSPARVEGLIR